ncbi:MAG: hypothetical protein ACI9T7_002466 [Oleiphilaceae bacterium]|jgi:hypothetical protein
MHLHIYIDAANLEEGDLNKMHAPVSESISDWVGGTKKNMQLLSQLSETGDTLKLGMSLEIKSKFKLKDPLNFLYTLAKEHKCEFAIAIISTNTGDSEDICYFGFEEGRPDLFEIANYLDL